MVVEGLNADMVAEIHPSTHKDVYKLYMGRHFTRL